MLSEEWKSFFTEICEENKIKVLHNSVNIPNYERERYDDNNVLFLGRLGHRKGTYDLLESIPEVLKEVPNAKFFLGGDGDIELCRKICIEKKINENVNFLGWVSGSDIEKYFKLCSVYILPSYNEGMPMSVLEAMSWECGVITTPVGGIPQVIDNKINGILVSPGNTGDIAKEITNLLTDRDKKEQLAKNAKDTIVKKFSMDKWCEKLSQMYII